MTPISILLAHTIDSCDIEELSCDIKNMEFFDRLWTSAIVNKEGEMAKTKIDTWGNIPLEDEVRKVRTCVCECVYINLYHGVAWYPDLPLSHKRYANKVLFNRQ